MASQDPGVHEPIGWYWPDQLVLTTVEAAMAAIAAARTAHIALRTCGGRGTSLADRCGVAARVIALVFGHKRVDQPERLDKPAEQRFLFGRFAIGEEHDLEPFAEVSLGRRVGCREAGPG